MKTSQRFLSGLCGELPPPPLTSVVSTGSGERLRFLPGAAAAAGKKESSVFCPIMLVPFTGGKRRCSSGRVRLGAEDNEEEEGPLLPPLLSPPHSETRPLSNPKLAPK